MPVTPELLRRQFAGGGLGVAPPWYAPLQTTATGVLKQQIASPFTPEGIPQFSKWQAGGIAPTLQGLYSQPWVVPGEPALRQQATGVLTDYMKDPFTAGFFTQRQAQAQADIGERANVARSQLAAQQDLVGYDRTPAFAEQQQRNISLMASQAASEALMQNLIAAEELRRWAVPEARTYESEIAGRQEEAERRRLQALQQAAGYDTETARRQQEAANLRQRQIEAAMGYEPLVTGEEVWPPFILGNEWLGLGGQVAGGVLGSDWFGNLMGGTVDRGLANILGNVPLGSIAGPAAASAITAALTGGVGTLVPSASAAPVVVGGITLPGLATSSSGVMGAIGGLMTNPFTIAAGIGLGLYFGLRGQIGKGRKTADRIVPTQNEVTSQLEQWIPYFWEDFSSGRITTEDQLKNHLAVLAGIKQDFFSFVDSIEGDDRAKSQARATIGGLIDQIVSDTYRDALPYVTRSEKPRDPFRPGEEPVGYNLPRQPDERFLASRALPQEEMYSADAPPLTIQELWELGADTSTEEKRRRYLLELQKTVRSDPFLQQQYAASYAGAIDPLTGQPRPQQFDAATWVPYGL